MKKKQLQQDLAIIETLTLRHVLKCKTRNPTNLQIKISDTNTTQNSL